MKIEKTSFMDYPTNNFSDKLNGQIFDVRI